MKKIKELIENIEIPEGITSKIENNILTLEKEDKKLTRKIPQVINIKIDGNKITISFRVLIVF